MEKIMPKRRQYSAEKKAAVVMNHLIERIPISELCEKHQINVNMFYRWQTLAINAVKNG